MRTVVLAGLLSVGCAKVSESPPPAASQPEGHFTGQLLRAQAKRLIGQTQDELKAILGKPDRTSDTVGREHWTYYNRTIDPASEKVDLVVLFYFKSGRVSSVAFQ